MGSKVVISTKLDNSTAIKDAQRLKSALQRTAAGIVNSFNSAGKNGSKTALSLQQGYEKATQALQQNEKKLIGIKAALQDVGNATSSAFASSKSRIAQTDEAIKEVRANMEKLSAAAEKSGWKTNSAFIKAQQRLEKLREDAIGVEDAIQGRLDRASAGFASAGLDEGQRKTKLAEYARTDSEMKVLVSKYERLNQEISKQEELTQKAKNAAVNAAVVESNAYQKLETRLAALTLKRNQQTIAMESSKRVAVESARTKLESSLAATEQQIEKNKLSVEQYIQKLERLKEETEKAQKSNSFLSLALSKVGSGLKKMGGGLGGVVKGFSNYGKGSKRAANNGSGFLKHITKLGTMLKLLVLRKLMNALVKSVQEGFRNLAQADAPFNASMSQLATKAQTMKNSVASAFAPLVSAIVPIFNVIANAVTRAMTAIAAFNAVIFGNAGTFKKAKDSAVDYAAGAAGAGSAAEEASGQLMSFDKLNTINKDSNNGGGGGDSSAGSMFEDVSIDDAFKELVNNPFKLGQTIAEGLNKAMESIDWSGIQEKVKGAALYISNLFNGFVAGLDWTLLGNTLGNGINTAMLFLFTMLTTIDWGALGRAVATGLSSAIDTIDWAMLGTLLAAKWIILIDFLYEFVTTFDWAKFGASLSTAVNSWFTSIDWIKAAKAISAGVRGLITSLLTFIQGVDWYQIGKSIKDFLVNIDWAGVISDLAMAIGAAIAGLSLLLWGFIEDAVKAIGEFFSQKFEESGGDIVKGLLMGIGEAIANIAIWLYNNLVKPFIDGFKSLFGIHSPSTVMAELGTFLMQGLCNGISSLVQSMIDIISNLWNSILTKTKEIWNTIKDFLLVTIWGGIKEGISNAVNNIKTTVVNIFTSLKTSVTNIFNGIWSAIKGVINSILGGIESMANGVVSGVNKIISALNGLGFDIPDWVPAFGGKSFRLNIPTIPPVNLPRLAQGAVIPPNREFMAILGDQKSGVNIETPLETMIQAFRTAMAEGGIGSNQDIVINLTAELDGNAIYDNQTRVSQRRGMTLATAKGR